MSKELKIIEITPIFAYKNTFPAKLSNFSKNQLSETNLSLGKNEVNKLYDFVIYLHNYKLENNEIYTTCCMLIDDGKAPTIQSQKFDPKNINEITIYAWHPMMIFDVPKNNLDILWFDGKPRAEKEIENILKQWKNQKN